MTTGGEAAGARHALVRLDDAPERLPDLLFVLVTPPEGGQPGGVEVRRTIRQDKAVTVYSAIDLLVGACGAGQPWEQITRDQLIAFCEELKVSTIILDAVLDVVPRYPEVDSRDQPPLEELEPLEEHDSYLYVPSRPVREGQYVVELELQPDPRGRPILLAYTSSELLVHGCGEHQPWVAIHTDDIADVAEESGAYGVLLNPVLADESRHAGPVHNWNSRSIGGN
ncbi:SAV_915 family protein [Amycolatopsis sp. NBC_01480]|uniref:SAV_915 family protein n=1 Tax=Amycolatopsis sp. NBC_01480 TaxID=2903562 RepID=UPI002E2D8828|nr:SAV_915 family protein [Amycolatopsis sp. NBC_01480]